jgi:release factor glutamine methyltransferase
MASLRTKSEASPRAKSRPSSSGARSDAKPITKVNPRNLRQALDEAIICLESAVVSPAPLTAELLLMHALGRDRAWLYARPEHVLSAAQREKFDHLIEQRATGIPTQYLTGRQEFWSLDFEVTPAVLIPRPETEHVIEVAVARLRARRTQPLRIADVGTGSGCIAIALAHEFPKAHIIATDISAPALTVARRNAKRHKVARHIEFVQTNILEAATSAAKARFDLIVSNPPYIGLTEAAQLPREVRDHEPHQALFAGEEGLAFYPQLIAQAQIRLVSGGLLIVELAHDAATSVSRLLETPQWRAVEIERDLAGIERVLSAERS